MRRERRIWKLTGTAMAVLAGSCGADGGWERDQGPLNGSVLVRPSPVFPVSGTACAPTGGGPYWIEEAETVSFTMSCGSGASIEPGEFEPAELPPGARWDPATATLTWTPGLDQAETVHVRVRVAATGEEAVVTIGVADRWYEEGNVPVADPTRYTHEFGLPVFFLDPRPDTEEFAGTRLVYRGRTWRIEARKRGHSSMAYPKNSYSLKFPKTDRFEDPGHGFLSTRRVNLTQTFDDNSYVRNRLAFDLWAALDPRHIRVKTFSAVVYLDGEYWGLYTVSDKVDGNLVEDHGLYEDGNLYEAVNHDADFSRDGAHRGWLKKEGSPPDGVAGAYDDLHDLIRFVDGASDGDFESGIASRIDMADYQDWWILVTFLVASDSAAKNSFHYHHDGPWRFVPWDFNAAAGQSWNTVRVDPDDDRTFSDKNRLFERLLESPSLEHGLRARYRDALDGPLSEPAVTALLDGYWSEIEASARRDERKWRHAYRGFSRWSWRSDFTTFEEEFAYVRLWLAERRARVEERYGGER